MALSFRFPIAATHHRQKGVVTVKERPWPVSLGILRSVGAAIEERADGRQDTGSSPMPNHYVRYAQKERRSIEREIVQRFLSVKFCGIWNPPWTCVMTVYFAALYLVCSSLGYAATGSPAIMDPPAEASSHNLPRIQDPQELEHALRSSDAELAKHLFRQFGCGPWNDDSIEVVKRAWEERDVAPAGSATRDPVVRTLLAGCLVGRMSRFKPLETADAPIIAELRRAVSSDNAEEVRAGAFGLARIATAEDVQLIAAAPTRIPALGSYLAATLIQVCRIDAADGIAKIRSVVTDVRQIAEIEALTKQMVLTRRTVCGFDANIVGSSVSAADIEDFWVPDHRTATRPTVEEIIDVLHSSDRVLARKVLRTIRCLPRESRLIDQVRGAWVTRDSSPADSVTRDGEVRVQLAVCLADASASFRAVADSSIATELRKSVKSGDFPGVVAGMEGLSRIATAADIRLIVDAVRRLPQFAVFAVGDLSTTCAPGAVKAAIAIRDSMTKWKDRDWMDGTILVTERVREGICGRTDVGHDAR